MRLQSDGGKLTVTLKDPDIIIVYGDKTYVANDIEIRISRRIGGWEVRINHAAIPVLFGSFAEAVKEIPEYVDVK